jgi:hypothetical protein
MANFKQCLKLDKQYSSTLLFVVYAVLESLKMRNSCPYQLTYIVQKYTGSNKFRTERESKNYFI